MSTNIWFRAPTQGAPTPCTELQISDYNEIYQHTSNSLVTNEFCNLSRSNHSSGSTLLNQSSSSLLSIGSLITLTDYYFSLPILYSPFLTIVAFLPIQPLLVYLTVNSASSLLVHFSLIYTDSLLTLTHYNLSLLIHLTATIFSSLSVTLAILF